MISILIPTYNFDVSLLTASIHAQLSACDIEFEMLIFEDGSQKILNTDQDLDGLRIIRNKENIGRVKARQFLAKTAVYDWLLFLDADVLPKNKDFISRYLKLAESGHEAIFGGFAYEQIKPDATYRLRWKYGKSREQVPAKKRNKTRYKIIISANYLIKKSVFNQINLRMTEKGYGYDNYLGALLKQQDTKVFHIDNEVYHLGIETSEDYLKKKEQAAETLLKLYHAKSITVHDNNLLALFSKLTTFRLTGLFSAFYRAFGKSIKRHLIGANPSIFLLQVYRISYMCYKFRLED